MLMLDAKTKLKIICRNKYGLSSILLFDFHHLPLKERVHKCNSLAQIFITSCAGDITPLWCFCSVWVRARMHHAKAHGVIAGVLFDGPGWLAGWLHAEPHNICVNNEEWKCSTRNEAKSARLTSTRRGSPRSAAAARSIKSDLKTHHTQPPTRNSPAGVASRFLVPALFAKKIAWRDANLFSVFIAHFN